MALDGYNDAEEAHRFLQAENIDIAYEAVEKQLRFMSLEDKEQRLIFHEILTDVLNRLEQSEIDVPNYCAKIYDVFHAVAQTESEHKIKSFSDNFIYLPKGVLLAYLTKLTDDFDRELYRKFILSKPKLAKACFNQFFGDYLPQI